MCIDMDIYLDNQATTATDPRVVDAMLPFFNERFGNPHSAQHAYGLDAAQAVAKARAQIAALIGAQPSEIVFTSGATEANNQAILGLARAYKGTRRQLVTSRIEHPCVSASMELLETQGFDVVYAPTDKFGRLDMTEFRKIVSADTLLVSIMAANNEIGVIQDIAAIGEVCSEHGAFFHTDAAQAAAKIHLDVDAQKIDLLGISGHKLYGPMGTGALYVRNRPDLRVEPLLVGGGQEFGLRSGTVAAPIVIGLGEACALGRSELQHEAKRLRHLRDRLLAVVRQKVDGIVLIGHPEARLPGNLNLCLPGVRAVDVIDTLDGVAISSASACATGGGTPSHVLDALGLTPEEAQCCLRVGLGRFTTSEEIDIAGEKLVTAFIQARAGLS
jgi:cysteine desulfurase